MRALVSPASLKGVLSAREAAAALAAGLRSGGAEAEELPVADGGEGTAELVAACRGLRACVARHVHDAFGRDRVAPIRYLVDGSAIVEAAEVIPLDPERLDPLAASSRGLGELLMLVGDCERLLVCLGGTATVDGGAGLVGEVKHELPAPTVALCDALVPLRDATRLFAAQKGASPAQVEELARRLEAMEQLAPCGDLPGAGAAGGIGAALAALGAELVPGARYVLELVGFRERAAAADVVVTGEGTVDASTRAGKAPGEVVRTCRDLGVRCVVFGGRVESELPGAETVALSGDPERAHDDLLELGARVAAAS